MELLRLQRFAEVIADLDISKIDQKEYRKIVNIIHEQVTLLTPAELHGVENG